MKAFIEKLTALLQIAHLPAVSVQTACRVAHGSQNASFDTGFALIELSNVNYSNDTTSRKMPPSFAMSPKPVSG